MEFIPSHCRGWHRWGRSSPSLAGWGAHTLCQTAPTPPHASTTIQQTDIRIAMSNSTHPTARFYNHTTNRHQDCRARNTVKSFLFVGHLILCISLVGQSTYLRSQRNVDFFLIVACLIWNSTNLNVREHVHHYQNTKFHAQEIKWIYSYQHTSSNWTVFWLYLPFDQNFL